MSRLNRWLIFPLASLTLYAVFYMIGVVLCCFFFQLLGIGETSRKFGEAEGVLILGVFSGGVFGAGGFILVPLLAIARERVGFNSIYVAGFLGILTSSFILLSMKLVNMGLVPNGIPSYVFINVLFVAPLFFGLWIWNRIASRFRPRAD